MSASMAMEGLTKHLSKLTLNDREDGKLHLSEERSTMEVILVAKFFTKCALNTEAIIRTFSPLWHSKNGFQVCSVGDHILLFVFDNEEETEKILLLQPWSFDKHLVAFYRHDTTTPVSELSFNKVLLWVQIHDLPLHFLNRGVAEELCTVIGEVCKDTDISEMEGETYFRVRVIVDMNIPLCRGRKISMGKGETGWVSFKYERLPILCYWCGCLDHTDRNCDKWIESDGTLSTDDREYGPWIRALPLAMPRKAVIKVPGYYESRKKEKGMSRSNRDSTAGEKETAVTTPSTSTVQKGKQTKSMDIINEGLKWQSLELNGIMANAIKGDNTYGTLREMNEKKFEVDPDSEATHKCGLNSHDSRATISTVDLDELNEIHAPLPPPLNNQKITCHSMPFIPNPLVPRHLLA